MLYHISLYRTVRLLASLITAIVIEARLSFRSENRREITTNLSKFLFISKQCAFCFLMCHTFRSFFYNVSMLVQQQLPSFGRYIRVHEIWNAKLVVKSRNNYHTYFMSYGLKRDLTEKFNCMIINTRVIVTHILCIIRYNQIFFRLTFFRYTHWLIDNI